MVKLPTQNSAPQISADEGDTDVMSAQTSPEPANQSGIVQEGSQDLSADLAGATDAIAQLVTPDESDEVADLTSPAVSSAVSAAPSVTDALSITDTSAPDQMDQSEDVSEDVLVTQRADDLDIATQTGEFTPVDLSGVSPPQQIGAFLNDPRRPVAPPLGTIESSDLDFYGATQVYQDYDWMTFEENERLFAQRPNYQGREQTAGWWQAIGADLNQDSGAVSLFTSATAGLLPYTDDGYDAWDDIKDDPLLLRNQDRFLKVHNRAYAEALKRQIRKEEEDKRIAEQSGTVFHLATGAMAGIIDGMALAPFLAIAEPVAAVRGASTVTGAIARGAATGAGFTAAEEAALQASQETRSLERSAINIAGGTLLGALLGGAAGALSRNELTTHAQNFEKELPEHVANEPTPDDFKRAYTMAIDATTTETERHYAAAAAEGGEAIAENIPASKVEAAILKRVKETQDLSIDDIGPTNKATEMLSKVLPQAVPAGRVITSQFPSVRDFGLKMVNYGYAHKLSPRRMSTIEADVESIRNLKIQQAQAFTPFVGDRYAEYIKEVRAFGEKPMKRDEFELAVNRDIYNGNISPNHHVRTASKALSNFYEKFRIEGEAVGVFKGLGTEKHYGPFIYNRDRIMANRTDFFQTLRQNLIVGELRDDLETLSAVDRKIQEDNIFQQILENITGATSTYDGVVNVRYNLGSGKSRFAKHRTLNLPYDVMEPWLNTNPLQNVISYAANMAPRIAMAKHFGDEHLTYILGRPATAEQEAITGALIEDARRAHGRVDADTKMTKAQKDKAHERIDRHQMDMRKDIMYLRDLANGSVQARMNAGSFAWVGNVSRDVLFMTMLGGVVLSSLRDITASIVNVGIGRFLREGLGPVLSRAKELKISKKQAHDLLAVLEVNANNRNASDMGLLDPAFQGNSIERFTRRMASRANKVFLNHGWDTFTRRNYNHVTRSEILRIAKKAHTQGVGKLTNQEYRYLSSIKMAPKTAVKLGEAFEKYGETYKGYRFLDDKVAMELHDAEHGYDPARSAQFADLMTQWSAAHLQETYSGTVRLGWADIPRGYTTQVGRLLLLFKGWFIAAYNKVLMRSLSGTNRPDYVIQGILSMMAVGSMQRYLKDLSAGREISDNPGYWIHAGIEESGLLSVFGIGSSISEAWGGPGLRSALESVWPDRAQDLPRRRSAIASSMSEILGPAFSYSTNALSLGSLALRNIRPYGVPLPDTDFTAKDKRTLWALTPGHSLPFLGALVKPHLRGPDQSQTLPGTSRGRGDRLIAP